MSTQANLDGETLELLQDFLQEASEALEEVEPLLVALDVSSGEQRPTARRSTASSGCSTRSKAARASWSCISWSG